MTHRSFLALALLASAVNATAQDNIERNLERAPGRVTVGSGFEFASGDYGSTLGDTDDWYVPFSLGYASGNWRVKVTVPYVRNTGPGNVISGGGDTRLVIDEDQGNCTVASVGGVIVDDSGGQGRGRGRGRGGDDNGTEIEDESGDDSLGSNDCSVTTTTTTTVITNPVTNTVTRSTASGLGDVIASAVYGFDPFVPAMPYVDLGARIKFPTANEDDGLGTGSYDYTLNMDLYKPFGALALLGGIGYTFKGDIDPVGGISSGLKLANVLASYIGAEYRFTDRWLAGVSGDYREAASPFAENAKEVSGYVTLRMNRQWSVTGTGGTGFTDASPNFFAGLSLVYGFDSPF